MLAGDDLVRLARDTAIRDLEEHLASTYEMRAAELNGIVQAVLGLSVGSLVGLAAALIQVGTGQGAADGGAFTLASNAGLVSFFIFIVAGFFAFIAALSRVKVLRAQAEASKHLANLLAALPWPAPIMRR